MAFHPDKCNVISVTRNKKHIEFDSTLHGHTLYHVTKAEYLGGSLFDFIDRYAMVSSANIRIVDDRPAGMSLI
jgi:hypothetical protein